MKLYYTIMLLLASTFCFAQRAVDQAAPPVDLHTEQFQYHLRQSGEMLAVGGFIFAATLIATGVMEQQAQGPNQVEQAQLFRYVGVGASGITIFIGGRQLVKASKFLK